MALLLSEKAHQARQQYASVGKVYPKDERFEEVKRNAEIRFMLNESDLEIVSGRRNLLGHDRAESLSIANDIMNVPGGACPKGEACVPFEYGNYTACRECNQVRDFGLNAGV